MKKKNHNTGCALKRKLSPNGEWLAWTECMVDTDNIWLKQLPNGKAHNVIYRTLNHINM